MYKTSSKKRAWCRSIALIPVFIAAFCVFSTKTIAQNDLNTLLTYESVENPVPDNGWMVTHEKEQSAEAIVQNEVKIPSKPANKSVENPALDNDLTKTPEMDVPKEQLPTVFEPNKDGKNELYIEGYDLNVFNRSGSLLFQGTTGWDGTCKGELMPEGTYYYVAKQTMDNGEQQRYTGFVRLTRQNPQIETKITQAKAAENCDFEVKGSTLEQRFTVRLNAAKPGEQVVFK